MEELESVIVEYAVPPVLSLRTPISHVGKKYVGFASFAS